MGRNIFIFVIFYKFVFLFFYWNDTIIMCNFFIMLIFITSLCTVLNFRLLLYHFNVETFFLRLLYYFTVTVYFLYFISILYIHY